MSQSFWHLQSLGLHGLNRTEPAFQIRNRRENIVERSTLRNESEFPWQLQFVFQSKDDARSVGITPSPFDWIKCTDSGRSHAHDLDKIRWNFFNIVLVSLNFSTTAGFWSRPNSFLLGSHNGAKILQGLALLLQPEWHEEPILLPIPWNLLNPSKGKLTATLQICNHDITSKLADQVYFPIKALKFLYWRVD